MKIALILLGCLVVAAAILLAIVLASLPSKATVTYKNKPLEAWFYGARTNFFQEETMRGAQDAIAALGTNAFPFLLSNLRENHGNGAQYFKIYGFMPAWLQTRVYYPISSDDIRAVTLNHFRKMRGLSGEQVQVLADCVPGFDNPRLRMIGFNLIHVEHQTDPAFLKLCRKLLNDEHQGIRLEAAISLAESAIASDPGEPRLFPILLTTLESKKERESSLDIVGYRYQQQPPGGSGLGPARSQLLQRVVQRPESPEEALRIRVEAAMYRLERHMSQEQKGAFRRAIK